jgi:hypothetical protein
MVFVVSGRTLAQEKFGEKAQMRCFLSGQFAQSALHIGLVLQAPLK